MTKITSPKNLLKALAGAIFGVAIALLGMSRPTMLSEPLAAHLLALAWAAHAIVLQRTGAAQRWWRRLTAIVQLPVHSRKMCVALRLGKTALQILRS